jgi:hypothetical protein
MDFQEVNVYPNITVSKKIVKAKIHVMEIKLFESVRFMVQLLDENDQVVDSRILLMENEAYKNWTNDDNYVLNWVKGQLTNR